MLQFTLQNGHEGFVNPMDVVWIEDKGSGSTLHLRIGESLFVMEPAEILAQKMRHLLQDLTPRR